MPEQPTHCPNRESHGNPFRYCPCGWREEPQNGVETADEAARRFADPFERARDAVRDGDWDALWRVLGIGPTQWLPEMHTPLDTAVPVPAGWLDTAAELAGLTVEQEIRVEALHAAVRTAAGVDAPTVRDLEQTIIGTAERYADWIAAGSTEAWDLMTPAARWAWSSCEACQHGSCEGHPSPEPKVGA